MIMEREIKHIQYYLELIFKENKMRIALKFLLGFFMFRIISGQELPQPMILGQDLPQKTLKISKFVEVSEDMGVVDDRVTLGISQIMEEVFLNETNYILTDKEDASFVASAEVVYLGKPNEAWSIVGILNGRKTQTEVRLNIKIKEAKTNEIVSKRGIGSTQTNIQATGLQINEEMEFGKSELGGALRKAIEDAILKH